MSLVRLVRVSAAPGKAGAVEGLLQELVPLIRAREGNVGALAFVDREAGEYGLFVQWATEAHADAARAVIGPRLMAGLEGNVREPADIAHFEALGAAKGG
jgi:hypothetical protein